MSDEDLIGAKEMLYSVAVFGPLAGALVAGLIGPAIGDRAAELAATLGTVSRQPPARS
jgi:hypothetical protein